MGPSLHRLSAVCLLVSSLAPAALAAQERERVEDARSVVNGRVTDHATGAFLSRVDVTLSRVGSDARGEVRLTGDNGTFRFSDVDPGAYTLRAGTPGYRVAEHLIVVEPAKEVHVVIPMSPEAIRLEPLIAITAREGRFMDGFEDRRAAATSHSVFFTHHEIQELNAQFITEVLWTVPGLAVQSARLATDRAVLPMQSGLTPSGSTSGRCMALYVNGTLVTGDVPYDDIFPPEDVAALEIYSVQHEVPAQFQLPGACGALVIWLRDRTFGSMWKRLIAGVGVGSLLFLLLQ